MPNPNPPKPDFDPDLEPQPYVGGHDPWRELQPEHDEIVRQQMEGYENERLEVAVLCVQVFAQGRGPELMGILKAMAKAMPRVSHDEIVRRDAKLDLLEWVEQEINFAATYEG